MKFDKALVVTGGKPKRLEIPGSELAHTIRHPEDVVRIHKASEGARNAVIIGTSFIGLEAASALLDYGLQVTVIGQEKLPFAKQFGEQVARSIMALHDSNGTKFRLGVEIVRITKESVTVREGSAEEELPADLVIMGVGVSPELGFTHDLPAATNGGGIKTDTSLRATQAVWVAGDIANMNGTRIEHWRVAQQHGRIAALGMMGQNATYEGVPFFWTYHFGKTLNYLGHAERWDETFIKGDIDELKFMVFYIRGGRVTAVLSCEYESQTAALAELMRGKLTLKEALSAVD
jgi:apoptosis-inducing factor 3